MESKAQKASIKEIERNIKELETEADRFSYRPGKIIDRINSLTIA